MSLGRKGHEVGSIHRTKSEEADFIEQFLDGTSGKYDWDNFTSVNIADDYLDTVRIQCRELWLAYPPQDKAITVAKKALRFCVI